MDPNARLLVYSATPTVREFLRQSRIQIRDSVLADVLHPDLCYSTVKVMSGTSKI